MAHTIDIKSLQNRLLKVCYVPATSASLSRLLFLRWPFTVQMKQTRQAVPAFKQSILLRCLWHIPTALIVSLVMLLAAAKNAFGRGGAT
jgi:hypothetical protein